jgi:hypothetical protein
MFLAAAMLVIEEAQSMQPTKEAMKEVRVE